MSRPAPTQLSRELDFEARRWALNTAGLRVGALLAATMVPGFSVLDWFVLPRHFVALLVVRLAVAAYALLCLGLAMARVSRYWISFLSVSLFTTAGLAISAMVYLDGGFQSSYYAGLMLVVMTTGVLFRWNWLETSLCYGLIYVSYFVPGLIKYLAAPGYETTLIGNNFFLVSTIVIISAGQYHGMQQLHREHSANVDLLTTKDALEFAYNDLKALDRLKSSFFSNVTHELRTPLTMILAPIESLLDEKASMTRATQREYLCSIRANAQRLLRLINDLLDLARLEEHHLQLRIEQADLVPLLHEIVEYARPLAARKNIRVSIDLEDSLGNLYVDLEKLERVIVNLVSNALKFTEPGGEVCVWSRELPHALLVGVRDSGQGIPADAQRWIFERFRQADDSVTRRYGGTGIGLSLAKEIVELHGGHIAVESEPGRGSNFVVHLTRGLDHFPAGALDKRSSSLSVSSAGPVAEREPREWTRQLTERRDFRFQDIEHATERRLAPRGEEQRHATKILVVEDNVEILRFLSLQLRDEHAVYLAPDGERGLALARAELPDVIVTDYMMPKMDGLALLKELKGDPRTLDIPVIMLTARNMAQDRLAAREAGADIYLGKPFSPQELRSAVSQLLRKRGRQTSVVVREQVKSLEVISAGLAHEIHNPLSYLNNAVHVIAEQLDTLRSAAARDGTDTDELRGIVIASQDKTARMLRVARTGLERIQRVVDLVRNYARAGCPREVAPAELDIMVRDVSRLLIPPDGRDVKLEHDLATEGVAIGCVPGEMEQVICNLLQNAIEAVPSGGHVWTRTRSDGRWVTFEVTDDGPGMPQDVLSRIFTPFFTTKEPGKGMGLGLAIAHQLVTQVGGDIAVESVVSKGTTFRVRVPLYQAPSTGA